MNEDVHEISFPVTLSRGLYLFSANNSIRFCRKVKSKLSDEAGTLEKAHKMEPYFRFPFCAPCSGLIIFNSARIFRKIREDSILTSHSGASPEIFRVFRKREVSLQFEINQVLPFNSSSSWCGSPSTVSGKRKRTSFCYLIYHWEAPTWELPPQ